MSCSKCSAETYQLVKNLTSTYDTLCKACGREDCQFTKKPGCKNCEKDQMLGGIVCPICGRIGGQPLRVNCGAGWHNTAEEALRCGNHKNL